MIGTIQIKCSAHNPSMPLCPVFAFQDSYQQVRISDVPKKIGDWSIKRVEVEFLFPDNKVGKFDCSLIGGVWATTISACSTAGTTTNGFVVNGYDENGNKYVLGKSDLYIMTNDSRIVPQKELVVVNILPNKPDAPHVGDAVFDNGKFTVFDGSQWLPAGPWMTSQLTNDAGYLTEDRSLALFYTKDDINVNTVNKNSVNDVQYGFGMRRIATENEGGTASIMFGSGPSGNSVILSKLYSPNTVFLPSIAITKTDEDTYPILRGIHLYGPDRVDALTEVNDIVNEAVAEVEKTYATKTYVDDAIGKVLTQEEF